MGDVFLYWLFLHCTYFYSVIPPFPRVSSEGALSLFIFSPGNNNGCWLRLFIPFHLILSFPQHSSTTTIFVRNKYKNIHPPNHGLQNPITTRIVNYLNSLFLPIYFETNKQFRYKLWHPCTHFQYRFS